MSVLLILLVGVAGGTGAAARFMLDGALRSWFATTIPWSTVAINVLGSGLLGLLGGLAIGEQVPLAVELIAGVGFLGGFTTFSTASVETARLIQSGQLWRAVVNGLGTAVLALLAAAAGVAIGALLIGG